MAGCDHSCKFRWADIRHPGVTSYYLAFSTSELGCKLEQEGNDILLQGNTLIGDNAWVDLQLDGYTSCIKFRSATSILVSST